MKTFSVMTDGAEITCHCCGVPTTHTSAFVVTKCCLISQLNKVRGLHSNQPVKSVYIVPAKCLA